MTARTKAKRRKRRVEPRPATPPTHEQRRQAAHRRMVDLIGRTKAQAEMEAEMDWRLSRALDGTYDGPMLGELLGDDVATRLGDPSPTLDRGTTLQRGAGR